MTKKIHAYMPFLKCSMQQKMTYKLNFVLNLIGQIIRCLIAVFLWLAVFDNSLSSTLEGFTKGEMVIYIIMSTVTSNMTANSTDTFIGYDVKDGRIGIDMLKPINIRCMLFFESLADFFMNTMFIAFPLWLFLEIYSINKNGFEFSVINCLLFILSVFLGFIILFLFNFCFGILAFVVTNMWGMTNLKKSVVEFLSGAIIPIVFFPKIIQHILFIFPFVSINYIPVMICMGKISFDDMIKQFVIQFLWIIILERLGHMLWSQAIKSFTMQGG